jgi:pSer/pThr/pTyr-binding forkhead associated (FHA) protein
MPYLQINDKQVQLRPGETRIGVGGQVEVRLPGPATGAGPLLAIVELGRDNHVTVRRAAADAVVRVNGVVLGAEPTPLLHGDKIEVAGTELYYGDDRKGGSTQFITAANVPDMARFRAGVPPRATAVTGGRVISLVDGREYTVGPGLVFGRDASCDVVIASSEVSRRHAEIVAGDAGYVVTDSSTNGLFVNGERVEGMQILGRADILRIGPEEFRFYADAAPLEAVASPPAQAGAAKSAPASPAAPVAPPPAGERLVAAPPIKEVERTDEPGEVEAESASTRVPRGAIATLLVVSGGVLKDEMYPVNSILAHLGRGEHNDVIIPEESISDSHAKLQRRDGVWYISDVGSTNGTYVAGRRITAEERLGQTGDIRLGGVKLSFAAVATEPSTGPRGATREMTAAAPPEPPRRAPPAPRPAGVGDRAAAPAQGRGAAAQPGRREASPGRAGEMKGGRSPSESRSPWGWLLVVAAAVAAAATFYFTKVR